MNMIIQRTIKLRLRPTPEQASILTQAIQAYTDSFNQVSAYGWTHKVFNGIELHEATYRTQRELFALPSQLAISARM
ncbi:MAG: helix-turn-helix domain-containing protein [Candidatus Sericytochromatia bacterium]|nr:helix-turn-helix domain-containing protein [Candidatus Sericytochromatia bacterium]